MFISAVKMPAGISRQGVVKEGWVAMMCVYVCVQGVVRMEIDQCAVTVHLVEAFEVGCSRLQPALFLIIA